MAQMFKVEDHEHQLVMVAPLETLKYILQLDSQDVAKLERETEKLSGVSVFFFHQRFAAGKWRMLRIQRMPLEIPRHTSVPMSLMKIQSEERLPGKLFPHEKE